MPGGHFNHLVDERAVADALLALPALLAGTGGSAQRPVAEENV